MTISRRLATLAALILLPMSLAGCGINAIPAGKVNAEAKWADVQSAYQRRADLIPNLVATVKGYAAQEKSVLTEVTDARARATGVNVSSDTITDPAKFKQFEAAQNQLSGSLGRLMLVVENYPNLKSNENFLALQSQLEGTENRINVTRQDYNEAVRQYNTSLVTLPTSIWAGTFYKSYKPMQMFQAAAGAQTAPTVSFEPTPAPAPASK